MQNISLLIAKFQDINMNIYIKETPPGTRRSYEFPLYDDDVIHASIRNKGLKSTNPTI